MKERVYLGKLPKLKGPYSFQENHITVSGHTMLPGHTFGPAIRDEAGAIIGWVGETSPDPEDQGCRDWYVWATSADNEDQFGRVPLDPDWCPPERNPRSKQFVGLEARAPTLALIPGREGEVDAPSRAEIVPLPRRVPRSRAA